MYQLLDTAPRIEPEFEAKPNIDAASAVEQSPAPVPNPMELVQPEDEGAMPGLSESPADPTDVPNAPELIDNTGQEIVPDEPDTSFGAPITDPIVNLPNGDNAAAASELEEPAPESFGAPIAKPIVNQPTDSGESAVGEPQNESVGDPDKDIPAPPVLEVR